MKTNKLRIFVVALLAAVAVIFSALALAACDGGKVKLTGITVENARVDFRINDEFEYGEYFAVYAHYSDGTEKDVTEEADIKKEYGFDMAVAGDYQITVSYGGKKEVYTVYVNEFESILRRIELDTSAAKQSFKLGEEFSAAGLVLQCTHENAQGIMVETKTSVLKGYTVSVTDAAGAAVNGAFKSFGSYTVTVSQGVIKASYKVTVAGVDISTVGGALAVGGALKGNVLSGTQTTYENIGGKGEYKSYEHTYTFGNNYTYVDELPYGANNTPVTSEEKEYHCSIIDGDLFCITLENGEMVETYDINSQMTDGALCLLYFSKVRCYGIENALNMIYREAATCTNKDLAEAADEGMRQYSFTYSGLRWNSVNSDYFEHKVTFTLGEGYNIEHVEIIQSCWENNLDNPNVTHTFSTDADGYTTPNGNPSYKVRIVNDQTAGARTEENPYEPEMFQFSSFNLYVGGSSTPLQDGETIKCNKGGKVYIMIKDLMPETATFAQDPLLMNYGGSFENDAETGGVMCTGFYAYKMTPTMIDVSIYEGGVWQLILKTANITKIITFDVTGDPPTDMTAKLAGSADGAWRGGDTANLVVNGAIYFFGEVNAYANAAQTAVITSANAADATIVRQEGGCFKFSAAKAGVYTVKVTSDAASSVSCTFTFTVTETPDFVTLLNGSYTATDSIGDVYTVTFTPAGAGQTSGTVTVKLSSEEAADRVETLSYVADEGAGTIAVQHVSGESLGVDFVIDGDGRFKLENYLGVRYALTPVA